MMHFGNGDMESAVLAIVQLITLKLPVDLTILNFLNKNGN